MATDLLEQGVIRTLQAEQHHHLAKKILDIIRNSRMSLSVFDRLTNLDDWREIFSTFMSVESDQTTAAEISILIMYLKFVILPRVPSSEHPVDPQNAKETEPLHLDRDAAQESSLGHSEPTQPIIAQHLSNNADGDIKPSPPISSQNTIIANVWTPCFHSNQGIIPFFSTKKKTMHSCRYCTKLGMPGTIVRRTADKYAHVVSHLQSSPFFRADLIGLGSGKLDQDLEFRRMIRMCFVTFRHRELTPDKKVSHVQPWPENEIKPDVMSEGLKFDNWMREYFKTHNGAQHKSVSPVLEQLEAAGSKLVPSSICDPVGNSNNHTGQQITQPASYEHLDTMMVPVEKAAVAAQAIAPINNFRDLRAWYSSKQPKAAPEHQCNPIDTMVVSKKTTSSSTDGDLMVLLQPVSKYLLQKELPQLTEPDKTGSKSAQHQDTVIRASTSGSQQRAESSQTLKIVSEQDSSSSSVAKVYRASYRASQQNKFSIVKILGPSSSASIQKQAPSTTSTPGPPQRIQEWGPSSTDQFSTQLHHTGGTHKIKHHAQEPSPCTSSIAGHEPMVFPPKKRIMLSSTADSIGLKNQLQIGRSHSPKKVIGPDVQTSSGAAQSSITISHLPEASKQVRSEAFGQLTTPILNGSTRSSEATGAASGNQKSPDGVGAAIISNLIAYKAKMSYKEMSEETSSETNMAATSASRADSEDTDLCPICDHPYNGETNMIACDTCNRWYHWDCVDMKKAPRKNQDWHCSFCKAGVVEKRLGELSLLNSSEDRQQQTSSRVINRSGGYAPSEARAVIRCRKCGFSKVSAQIDVEEIHCGEKMSVTRNCMYFGNSFRRKFVRPKRFEDMDW